MAIIVIAAAIFFFMKGNGSDTQTAGETASTDTASEETAPESTSLKKLLASGSKKCTFETTEGGTTSKGTFYVADGKARGDFSTSASGQDMVAHMIMENNTSYLWQEGSNTGIKMAFDAETADSYANSQAVDPNKEYKYDCDSWNGDKSIFTPPSNVTFSEMAIPSIPATNSPAGGMTPEAICNSLPDPAKTQCLANIKKN